MSHAAPATQRLYSFSLVDLFKLVCVLAIVFAAHSETTGFGFVQLKEFLQGCIVFGLACQAWDLTVAYRGMPPLPREERDGWLFAITWRVVLCLMILIGMIILQFEAHHSILFRLVSATILLAVILGIRSGFPRATTAGTPTGLIRVLRILGWTGCCVFAVAYIRDQTAILKLVFNALVSLETSQSAIQYSYGLMKGIDPNVADRSLRFFWSTLPAAICLLITCILFVRLNSLWNRTGRPNRYLLFAIFVAWLPTIIYPLWVAKSGMRQLSPPLAEGLLPLPLYTWAAALTVAGLLIVAGAHHLTSEQTSAATTWRRSRWRYLHERRSVLLLLLLTIGIPACMGMTHPLPTLFGRDAIILWDLFYLVDDLTLPLVCILSLALYRHTACQNESVNGSPPKLHMARFVTTSLLLFALLVGGVGTGAGFSFALSLVP